MTSSTGGDHQTRPGCGQMRYLGARNERLAWRQHGKQGRAVVWVHGLPLDSRSWLFQERHFAGRARNFLVDLRGYGCSGKLPDPPGDVTQLYVNDLHNLITTLSLSDAVLVGFASGAHVALRPRLRRWNGHSAVHRRLGEGRSRLETNHSPGHLYDQ